MDIQNCTNLVAVEKIGRTPVSFLDQAIPNAPPVLELAGPRHSQSELIDL